MLAADISFGQIRSGRSVDYSSPVQVVMVQTAVSRLNKLPWPDLIIIDECHLAVADSYVKVINAVGRPLLLGLTGTPQRLDNRGLIEVFDRLVLTCSTFELMQEGLLAKVRLFNPGTSGALSGKGSIAVGDALSHWKRECQGRRGVAFCMSIAHSEAIADQWNRAGYRAMAVHGRSSKEDRKRAIRGLRSGDHDLVACAKLWIAGVDVPEIDAVLWLRKTSSLVDWLQGCGRGMRIAPGKKDLIILDHVGNSAPNRLDHPLVEREWSLHGHAKKKRDAALSVKVCPSCFSAMPSAARVCPDCGHEFVVERRELQTVDGKLVEVIRGNVFKVGDKVQLKICKATPPFTILSIVNDQEIKIEWPFTPGSGREPMVTIAKSESFELVARSSDLRRRQQATAQTLDELIAIGRARNMKNPAGWARHVMAARSLRSGKARVKELVLG